MGSGTLCLLSEDSAGSETAGEQIRIGGAAEFDFGRRVAHAGEGWIVAEEPWAGNFGKDVLEARLIEVIVRDAIGGREIGGPGKQDMRLDGRKDGGDGAFARLPIVLPEEGGAVIDRMKGFVPEKEVGIAGSAIDVSGEGVEPDEEGRLGGAGEVARGGIEHAGAGKEVHADVPADAAFEQIADLGVGLVAAELGVDFDEDELGDGERESVGETTADEFGDEGERTLSGSAELEDVQAEVVRFDDGRQRATLAQRHDVTDGAHAAERLAGTRGCDEGEQARWCDRQRCASLREFFP